MKKEYFIVLWIIIAGLLAFSVSSIIGLKNEVTSLKAKVNIGASITQVPNHSNIFKFTSDEPLKGKGVWFVVSPKGIPAEDGSNSNFAGIEIWRVDASSPDTFANLEWLEITSGSPCYGVDDFLISTNRFGNGKCRDLVFGTMRTDTNTPQQAFRIVSTEFEDIYTLFGKNLKVNADLILDTKSRLGLFGVTPVGQQAHIGDASSADLTEKFNALLKELEAYGLLGK